MKAWLLCILFTVQLCLANEVSGATKSVVTHFIRNMLEGKSRLFFEHGHIREGRVVRSFEIEELIEQGAEITVKVRYQVVGDFQANESNLTQLQIVPGSSRAESKVVLYSFSKKGKTYQLKKNFERVPYLLASTIATQ